MPDYEIYFDPINLTPGKNTIFGGIDNSTTE